MKPLGVIVLIALAAVPVSASAQTVEVPFSGKFGRIHYWCAAGKKVIANGFPATTMIYRTSPMHRSAGQGMTFSLDGGRTGPWNAFPAFAAANMCNEGSGKDDEYDDDYQNGDGDYYPGDGLGGVITAISNLFN